MDSKLFQGPAGRLDARLHGPAGGAAVLLLHPHPQFGGTMGSRLVYDLAIGLAEAGFRAVRFDFRGVGRSDGSYDGGEGEARDALAVFDSLVRGTGQSPSVVGYSFGAGVACRLATLRTPRRLVLVGCPLRLRGSALDPLDDAPRVHAAEPPVHVVVGDWDDFVTPDEARQLADAFQPPAKLTVLPGAGHFLEPTHNQRGVDAVRAALQA